MNLKPALLALPVLLAALGATGCVDPKAGDTTNTPLYVYDADTVKARYCDLFKFIPHPKLKIHYAMKANYNPALLAVLRDRVSSEAASPTSCCE